MKMFPTPERRREGSRWDHMIRIGRPLMGSKFIVSRALSAGVGGGVGMRSRGRSGEEGKKMGGRGKIRKGEKGETLLKNTLHTGNSTL